MFFNKKKDINTVTIVDDNTLYNDIILFAIDFGKISASLIQRKFRISYNRAINFIDKLENEGIIGPSNGSNPRLVLIKSIDEIYVPNSNSNNSSNFDNVEQLLYKIDNDMNGFEFEQLTKEILFNNGFKKIIVTKISNDYGADLIAIKDDIKYAIQCKKYSNSVGVEAVQEILGSKTLYNCHVAVVLTNSAFTQNAKKLAEINNILLWDREKLKDMISISKNNK